MSGSYQEHPPPARLAPYVECFWSIQPTDAVPEYPVLPDGCVDIVYSPGRNREPQVVGTMTHAQKFTLAAGRFECGVRFRPGMSASFLRVPGAETTDRSLPLSEIWGAEGRRLSGRLADATSAQECLRLIGERLTDPVAPDAVQRICAFIVERRGQVRMDDLAFQAALSARQLRRLFLHQTGLSPKHFCRVIRFRHSLSQLRGSPRGDWTGVALDSGYYDQAHFINEFREFSGYTPGEFATLPR